MKFCETHAISLDYSQEQRTKFEEICLHYFCRLLYFVSELTFVVPPWNFLGEKEETTIGQWLSSDKGKFLQNYCSSKTKEHGIPTTLTGK